MQHFMNNGFLFSFLVLLGLPGLAQQVPAVQASVPAGERISLQQAIDIALANNLQIKQGQVQIENDRITLNQSRYNRLPNANASVSGPGASFGRGIDPFTNSFVNQQITFNSYNLNSSTTLFAAGQLKNTIKQNEFALQATQQDVENTKQQTSLNVVLAYLQILNTEDQLSIARSQVDVSRLQLERTEKLVRAGSLAQASAFDLRAQLANDELSVVNAENNLTIAKVNLLQLLNVNANQDIQVDRISINTPNGSYEASPDQVYATAVGNQPVVKAADFRILSAGRAVEVARGSLYPSLLFNGNFSTNYSSAAQRRVLGGLVDVTQTATVISPNGVPTPITFVTQQPSLNAEKIPYFNQLRTNYNVNLSLSLRIPIFNNYQARLRVAGARLTQDNLRYQSDLAKLQLRQTIEQAYTNLIAAQKRFAATTVQVESLEQAFKASESRFNAGAINSVDYNLAKTNLDRARANLVQAKYDFIFRTKILDFYQNKPLSF